MNPFGDDTDYEIKTIQAFIGRLIALIVFTVSILMAVK